MRRSFHVYVLVCTLLIPCLAQERDIGDPMVDLSFIMRVLTKYHVYGSFEYSGSCEIGLPLPELAKLHAPKNDTNSPIESLREVFADYKNIQITQDHNGMIRIVQENVPSEILEVKISHLTFKREADPVMAMWKAVGAKEVAAFKEANHLGPEFYNVSHPFPIPGPKSPRLSADLQNVTLAQVLDKILETFPGLWIYKTCPSWDKNQDVNFAIYQNHEGWALLTHKHPMQY